MKTHAISLLSGLFLMATFLPASAYIVVNQTTDGNDLAGALGGSGLSDVLVTKKHGHKDQFGTYTGFSEAPVVFSDGVVLSTGMVEDTPGPVGPLSNTNHIFYPPASETGTSEFDAYGNDHITNFRSSHEVAAMQVDFTLSEDSQVAFDFIFGSVEYPEYTSDYTDAFLVFLDGTEAGNQITYDSNGKPVQVGDSFASSLTTEDKNTAFGEPYGLLGPLTTFTGMLSAGRHSLLFEVGDVNDPRLDSAAFIANLRTGTGEQGTGQTGSQGGVVSEPGALAMLALGFVLIGAGYRGHKARSRENG